ncbi:MAG: hypothetical protein ACI4QX_07570 [Lachnospiraceae bacterium]
MPWCPNCKTEYREGITHCADCKAELVATLDLKEIRRQNATALLVKIDGEQKEFIKKLADFLEYSGIAVNLEEEDGLIAVYTAPEDLKEAKRHFQAFYSVETERAMEEAAENAFLSGEETEEAQELFDDEEEASDTEDDSASSKKTRRNEKNYVSSVSRYNDYRSSGFTFTIFGVLGIAFALLNMFGVIPLFGSLYSSAVILLMFAAFLAMGIFSFVKSGKLKSEAAGEEKLTAEVKKWLEENVTEDMLRAYDEKCNEDGAKSTELLYLNRLDRLCETLLQTFPDLNASFAEQLIEDFYSARFD